MRSISLRPDTMASYDEIGFRKNTQDEYASRFAPHLDCMRCVLPGPPCVTTCVAWCLLHLFCFVHIQST
jgi:hypothetical protein